VAAQAASLCEEEAVKTILVPLDGSALAEQSLPYVRLLAPILGARVRLLRVVMDLADEDVFAESMVAAYGVLDPQIPQERVQQAWETRRKHAEGYLASLALQLQGDGLDVATEVRIGPPAEVIVETAAAEPGMLIAMATHGRSGLRRWALGSVTDKVIHATSSPVLVVRGGEAPTDLALRRILVPQDGSELARQALPLAIELARSAKAELLLLEAVPPLLEAYPGMRPLGRPLPNAIASLNELREQAQRELTALASTLSQEQVGATVLVVSGYAAETIVDAAAQHKVDLIVMATHGYSGLRRWTLGSVADKVLHTSTTPLLLVRAQETRS
jgi:nucleotide-binding universal stress UspA family protein